MIDQELTDRVNELQRQNAELNRANDVLIAQKDLLQSELNLLYLIDESKDGAKSVLILDIKTKTKTLVVKQLMDILYKHLTRKTGGDGLPMHILDMSFVEYVDFIYSAH